jgi:hypothetical protein
MRPRFLTIGLAALLAALLAGASAAQGLPEGDVRVQPYRPQNEPPGPAAARVLDSFSSAWSLEDAGGVADLVPPDGRATVAIEGRSVEGRMGRGQIEALLTNLFSETERAAFDLSDVHQSEETAAWAVGEWTYEARGRDRRRQETIFVVIRRDLPGNWVLSELRIRPSR